MINNLDLPQVKEAIKTRAMDLGFDLFGVAPAEPSSFKPEFEAWLANGFHGEMAYLARNPDRRTDPELVLPGAKSIISVAMNYYTGPDEEPAPDQAIFARYARGDDYHDVMTPRLHDLLNFIKELTPGAEGKVYVDTGPILEREVAQRSGLGWFGKNSMLINTKRGSWFLLGEILLNLELPPDRPAIGQCGTCTKCLDACPTQAIVAPYVVDANKCISYLTIELKGPIPEELFPKIGNRIFGCDICQEVCPFNVRRASATDEPAFQPREVTALSSLKELAELTEDEFRQKFKGSPVKRAKWRGLRRNVEVGLSSSDESEAEQVLTKVLVGSQELLKQ